MASQAKKMKASLSLPELLAETLECPVCRKTIQDPPVFQCEKGHELCNPCREQIKAEGKPCPVCRGKLTDTRALAVERMLEQAKNFVRLLSRMYLQMKCGTRQFLHFENEFQLRNQQKVGVS